MIVTAAPDVIYARDQNGDLKADERRVLYTGFTEGNQQHRVNGLRWGLDGWLYLANGDSGGEVKPVGTTRGQNADLSQAAAVNVRGRDLRIHPDTGRIDAISGQTQFGRERDDFGNWFGNNNSNPIWHYVLADHYLRRNPHATGASTKAGVAEIPGAAPVFPTSQTLARFNDFGSANRFTSACSTSIYRDDNLGAAYYGNAFTCEPVHNLVSRLVLEREGVGFRGYRAEEERESEFLASSDNWTRPVMVRTGPDGAVYVADMYRQVIEHPEWIPAEYQRKLALQAGNDLGRIYRIIPAGDCCSPNAQDTDGKSAARVSPEANLRSWFTSPASELANEDLVARLASSNGWWRDTAQRLLEHREASECADSLLALTKGDSSPAVRVQAMHTLANLQSADSPERIRHLVTALQDSAPEVRRHAVQLLEKSLAAGNSDLFASLSKLANDESLAVRQQLALSLGMSPSPNTAAVLAELLNHSSDAHIVNAVMTSLTPENIGATLQQAIGQPESSSRIVNQLMAQAAAMKKTDVLKQPVSTLLKDLVTEEMQSADQWTRTAQAIQSLQRSGGIATIIDSDGALSELYLQTQTRAGLWHSIQTRPLRLASRQFVF